MKNIDLIVLGEVALDVVLAGVDKIPHRWSEVGNVQTAGVFTAGSAGYVAQCFAKLGGRAAIVGRIGDDSLGRIVIEGFHDCGVFFGARQNIYLVELDGPQTRGLAVQIMGG